MPDERERIARNEQALSDLRADIAEIREAMRSDHHRLRSVESSVSLMIDAQKRARRAEALQYRRVELRLQWLALSVGVGGLLMSVALVAAAFIFKQ